MRELKTSQGGEDAGAVGVLDAFAVEQHRGDPEETPTSAA
jgi:hypothetical protein